MSTILYLETFVDSTQGLPPDLQRQLTNIKALDEKCESLSAQVQEAVVQLQAMPPQHSTGSSPSEEYVNLSCRVEADQRLLLQFAEEKVMIAQQVYDLLEMHMIELDKQIDDFEGDMRVNGIDGNLDFYSPNSYIPLDSMRGRTPKLEDWGSLAPAPAEPGPLNQPPIVKRQASQINNKGSNKRPRGEDLDAMPTPAGPPNAAGGASGPKKARAAGSMANSAASLGGDDYGLGEADAPEPIPPLVGFMSPAPPGLQAAAPRPQAPGKYLYQNGITEELRGRHAELFWPPDSMWYLIEIQEVNVDTKMARIMYITGESEELNLDEIARDMHMSIISLDA
mmetsp:Transcript_10848/g.32236  ORF Transcript_10848/g.32236 Transcript_10848/m.32236 type:complete len:338 (-) Transcript_10848:303-1316(-)